MNGIPAIHPWEKTYEVPISFYCLAELFCWPQFRFAPIASFTPRLQTSLRTPESSAATFRTSHAKYLALATAQIFSEPIPAVVSVQAFVLPETVIAQDATQTEISGNHAASFALALTDPQNEARPSISTPAMLAVNGFQPGAAFGGSDAENSWVLVTLVPAAPEPGGHSGDFAALGSSGPVSSEFSTDGSRLGFFGRDPNRGKAGKGQNKNQNDAPVPIPEPSAASLLMLGLLAVGIMASRNRDFSANA